MNTVAKILSLVFTLLFISFAAVQYNDPDVLVWVYAYLVPVYISFSAFRNQFNKGLIWSMLIGSVLGAITFFPYGHFEGVALKDGMKTMNIEYARESLGLAVVSIASLIHLAQAYFQSK
ncbi:MAG: transmembrane 220 family protein [Chitinophagales bacterium]|nr:transmembrane 220 family protein [Chitinophagales bacterium]